MRSPPPPRPVVAAALVLAATGLSLAGCGDGTPRVPAAPTASAAVVAAVDSLALELGAEVALYYRELGGGDSVLVRPDLRFHAASTMKVPVLVRLYQDGLEGRLSLDDVVEVTPTFSSIVDGSPYTLDPARDSDPDLYARVGNSVALRELAEHMVARSSNLATNLLVRALGAERVTETMRVLGADSTEILRGVEDVPAFEAGLVNTTTARDLGALFRALEEGALPWAAARSEMVGMLERHTFREKIPAGLPAGVRVANQTGWIEGVSHDAALVYPPADPPYVVVVLTRGVVDPDRAERLIAEISRRVWQHHVRGRAT